MQEDMTYDDMLKELALIREDILNAFDYNRDKIISIESSNQSLLAEIKELIWQYADLSNS